MDKLIKKYTAVIVLAPEITKKDDGIKYVNGNFSYFIKNDPYEFRFKAVKKIFEDGATRNFILVGGTVKDENRDTVIINSKAVPKAEVMRERLTGSMYGIPPEYLYVIQSVSNTEGNAIEIAKYLSEKNIFYINNIGLLTNFYHLSRAIRIFTDVANLRLIPICAESIVYYKEYENIKKFYENELQKTEIIMDKDKGSEIKGMADRERGFYYPKTQ